MPGDDRKWRELYSRVLKLKPETLRVGVFEDSGTADSGISMAELAAIHEFGAPRANIPERSFIRFTMTNKQPEIAHQFELLAKHFFNGRITDTQMLQALGIFVRDEVKKSITGRLIKQDLAPATIARKGHTTALIDTGRLLEAISFRTGST